MSFMARSVTTEDLSQLVDLAKQFTLLNLPGDKRIMSAKIERSMASFAGKMSKEDAEYLFVLEDIEERAVVGSSLIIGKHGSDEKPHNFFKLIKRNHYSEDLGLGFIHQILRFQIDTDGPTEIGGLLVDKAYRRRPEKLGKHISFARFNYMATHPDRFEERVLCELTPPLTEDGRSEFWDALGRRFTGLPYYDADLLSQTHKEFITSLFPEDDIYVCLLDTRARTVIGRVGEATRPAQMLLEGIGFEYLEEVDPFDGGPHYGAKTEDILPIKQSFLARVVEFSDASYKRQGLVGIDRGDYKCVFTNYDLRDDEIALPHQARKILDVEADEQVRVSPYGKMG